MAFCATFCKISVKNKKKKKKKKKERKDLMSLKCELRPHICNSVKSQWRTRKKKKSLLSLKCELRPHMSFMKTGWHAV